MTSQEDDATELQFPKGIIDETLGDIIDIPSLHESDLKQYMDLLYNYDNDFNFSVNVSTGSDSANVNEFLGSERDQDIVNSLSLIPDVDIEKDNSPPVINLESHVINLNPESSDINLHPESSDINLNPESHGINLNPESSDINLNPESHDIILDPESFEIAHNITLEENNLESTDSELDQSDLDNLDLESSGHTDYEIEYSGLDDSDLDYDSELDSPLEEVYNSLLEPSDSGLEGSAADNSGTEPSIENSGNESNNQSNPSSETEDISEYGSCFENDNCCDCCQNLLVAPYIECNICTVAYEGFEKKRFLRSCMLCFTEGQEFSVHINNHEYAIVKTDFPLFDSKWSAEEEVMLLDAVARYGLGNWDDISTKVKKSAGNCKKHYFMYYINNPVVDLDMLPPNTQPHCKEEPYPVPHLMGSENPVRPIPGTALYREMSGYNAARADFIVEHLDDAEDIINDIDINQFQGDEDEELMLTLQTSLVDIYLRKVKEREHRKSIIKEHGLINYTKANSMLNYFKGKVPELSAVIPKLFPLLLHEELAKLIDDLNAETELKQKIQSLKEYRCNGLKLKCNTESYENIKARHELHQKKKKKLIIGNEGDDTNVTIEDLTKLSMINSSVPASLRRLSVPLNISGEADYHILTEEEKSLTSSLRIIPKVFNQIKEMMIEECSKSDGLHLRQARALFKIDVNKTRRIFDFLMTKGLIYKPNDN